MKKGEDDLVASASGPMSDGKEVDRDIYRLRLGGVAPILGALAAVGFGLMICAESGKDYRINRLEIAASRTDNDDDDQLRTRIACLTEAVSLGPEDARLHFALGSAHGRLAELLVRDDVTELLGGGNLRGALRRLNAPEGRAALEQGMLALREHLRARDACPLLSEAHIGIASHASGFYMKRGDNAEDYFRRAKLLRPGQVETWYKCGLQESLLMQRQEAFATWRHCLELSDQHLPQILDQTSPLLKTNQLLEKVLPDDPKVLLAAAFYLYREPGWVERRRPFLERALHLLESKEEGLGPQDLLTKARIYRALKQPDQAIPLYREFLNRDPFQVRLRYEFASCLRDVGKLREARHELRLFLVQEPDNGAAKDLLDAVLNEMLQVKSQLKRASPRMLRAR